MRLEGSLDAFSLPDIFQLLSFTKKTGGLHLRRDALHGVVYVSTGSLTGGSSDVNRQGLARRLVGAGAIEDDALTAAVAAAQSGTDLGVARALQQAGTVDEAVLHEAAAEHVIDTVFDLMRWPDGDFTFVIDEPNPDDVGVSVSVEEAVAEARRRLESWAGVSTTVPSPESVLAVALTPPEDPMLSREEWALLALVDGRRAVSDVVGATGRGEFAVVSALASLVDRGLLVVTGDGQPPAVAALLRRLSALTTVEGVGPVVDPVERRAVGVDDAVAPPDAPLPDDLAAAVPDDTEIDLDAAVAPEQREPLELEQSGPLAEADDSMPGADAEPVVPPLAEEGDDVVAPRAESLRGRRRPSHQDDDFASASAGSTHPIIGQVDGTAAVAPEMAPTPGLIERDPSVNKSLLLRLIAGVRGL